MLKLVVPYNHCRYTHQLTKNEVAPAAAVRTDVRTLPCLSQDARMKQRGEIERIEDTSTPV